MPNTIFGGVPNAAQVDFDARTPLTTTHQIINFSDNLTKTFKMLIPTKKIAHSELSAINISPNNHSFRLEDYGPSTLFRFNTLRLSRNLGMRDRDISERAIALTSEQLSRNSGIRTKRTRSRWVTISTAYGLTIKPLAAPRWEALAEAVGDKRDRCTGRHGHWVLLSNEAEDPVQDVFATFLDRLDQFEGRPQLRTWLFGILHRKTLDWRRAAAVDDRMDPIDVTAT